MAIEDIPVFRPARRGQVVRSSDWNGMQQDLRHSIRTHRHTRIADEAVDDSADDDLALQIETAEIADAAITLDKLGSDVRTAIDQGGEIGEEIRQRLEGTAQVTSDEVVLESGAREQIEHGLGSVPVAIVVGVFQRGLLDEIGLEGEFDLYGGGFSQGNVLAAVPREPDGTFLLIARTETEVTVRWWAFARTVDL